MRKLCHCCTNYTNCHSFVVAISACSLGGKLLSRCHNYLRCHSSVAVAISTRSLCENLLPLLSVVIAICLRLLSSMSQFGWPHAVPAVTTVTAGRRNCNNYQLLQAHLSQLPTMAGTTVTIDIPDRINGHICYLWITQLSQLPTLADATLTIVIHGRPNFHNWHLWQA